MGKSLEKLHKEIMQYKNLFRGIHRKCSKQHLFPHADGYVLDLIEEITKRLFFIK